MPRSDSVNVPLQRSVKGALQVTAAGVQKNHKEALLFFGVLEGSLFER